MKVKRFGRPDVSRQELALFVITIFWGTTFLIIHTAMRHTGPLFFVGFRFLCAAILSFIIFRRILTKITKIELLAGISIGFTIFLGYGLQTAGLQSIASSQSAFISALYVPMVPILQWIIFKKAPFITNWIGITLAFIGVALTSDLSQPAAVFNIHEIQTFLGALAIAFEIVLIGFFSNKVDIRRVTIIQLVAAAFFSFAAMVPFDETIPAFSWVWVLAAMSLGVMSCIIQLTMNWAQKSLSPSRATVIYACEPVWAGVIGFFAGDHFSRFALVGAAAIFGGVIIGEFNRSNIKAKALAKTHHKW